MPAPSSTVFNTSDQNYQAMLTTELLDTVNIVDVPADLSIPFDRPRGFQTKYAIVLSARSLRLVTAESTCSRLGKVILDIYDVFT